METLSAARNMGDRTEPFMKCRSPTGGIEFCRVHMCHNFNIFILSELCWLDLMTMFSPRAIRENCS